MTSVTINSAAPFVHVSNGRAVVMIEEGATEACGWTDGRTDMHRSTFKGYHLFSYTPQAHIGAT
jgi:hypothetical protein